MTNPAQLLLAGNPGKKRKKRWTKAKPAPATSTTRAAIRQEVAAMLKERPMAKRRKKSKASREKRIAKRRARRASRKGKMPAGLRAYWAKRKSKGSIRRKSRRRSRKARLKVRRSRRRSRARRHVKNVVASKGTRVVVRKVRRGRVRYARKRSGRRVVGVNAGSLTLTGGFTNFLANAKATMQDGVKGFAFAFGGAAVSVAGGAFTSQVTGNLLARFAPNLLSNPIVSRLLGAVNYYLPGWAASRFVPGLSGKSRRAMLTGAAAAAILEVVRPGMIRNTLRQVPVIGGLMGVAEDQAEDLGAYVGYALSGTNDSHNGAVIYEDTRMDPPGLLQDYVALSDYVSTGGEDAAQNVGVADYVALR